ncbi:Stress response protein NST1 [Oopsacas minuta]|uniref:Stress response protein NST1 n=1 Tax=Oopsacas minuta TaxID=111878 RepID=A0AAV7KJW9_9METZ|nr:Stress response protein NST1 [Oopsacas minuta]
MYNSLYFLFTFYAHVSTGQLNNIEMSKVIDYSAKKGNAKACFGMKGKSLSELDWPRGVVIDHISDTIYVSERDLGRILLFNQKGFLFSFSTKIARNFYMCIANGLIYMSNFYNNTVSVYDLTGDFITLFGGRGSGLGKFDFPQGITFDEELNKMFICDRDNSRVQVFSDFYIRAITSTENSPLNKPRDVKFSSTKLFIMDLCKFCIKIYDPCYPYTPQNTIITSVTDKGPYYFELDPNLNILLSNYIASEIEVYSPEGELLHVIASKGTSQGCVLSPNGIAITKQGDIVSVCVDRPTGMIQIF